MGLIIVVQKSLNKAGIETMNKMRVINRQTGDIFNVKVNPYLPSKAYQAIEKNNPLGYIIRRNDTKREYVKINNTVFGGCTKYLAFIV